MPPRLASDRPLLLTWSIAALLFGGTVLLYSPVIGYRFVNYDDPKYVLLNPHIQAPFGWSSIVWAFTARAELWQPLTWFSHMFDWWLYGDNASGHHLTSILWHALNAVLVFTVFRQITGGIWRSALAAAVFAWHPLRVESVAWITERKDVMSGCFFLLTIWAYLAYGARRRDGRRASVHYLVTLLVFALGLACKPTLVTLPFVLLAFDFWPLRRGSAGMPGPAEASVDRLAQPTRPGSLLLEKLPFFVLSLIVGLLTVHLQRGLGNFTLDVPLGARLANVPVAMLRYLGKFFWPANLSVCYPHPGWWPVGIIVGAAIPLVLLTAAAWRWRQTRPWLLTGWVWFVALLLPTIGILQVGFQSMADRYTYLPLLGGWSFRNGRRAFAGAVAAGGVVALLALGWRTRQQETVWRDSLTLFEHAVAVSGSNTTSEAFLGYTLASLGRVNEAARHSRRALELDPRNEMAVYTLARLDAAAGRTDAAIAGYRRSLALKPDDPATEVELALQLLIRGDTAEAARALRHAEQDQPELGAQLRRLGDDDGRAGRLPIAALRYVAASLLRPDDAGVHLAAGATLARLGRDDEAFTQLSRAVTLNPGLAEAHLELGTLLRKRGAVRDALSHYQLAVASAPGNTAASVGVGRCAESLGDTTAADAAFAHALAVAPGDADVVHAWAEVLARRGRFSDALPFYQRAVQLRPANAVSHAELGYILFLTGKRDEAAAAWREALRLNPQLPDLRERLDRLSR